MSAIPQLSIEKNAKTELACGYTQRASRGKCNYNSAYQTLLNKSKGIILLAGIIATTERRKANEDIYVASGVCRKGCSASAKVRSLLVRVMKNSASAEAVQGYTAEELISHLESLFTKGMSWDNRSEWHIDHIKPVSLFVKEGVADPAVINALSNLQPLWARDNLTKGAKYIENKGG